MPLKTTTVHGHEVAYRTAGRGPVVVLIHGMAGSSATWIPVIDALAEHMTVVAPDLPGHGRSAKPRGDYSLGAHASFLRDLLAKLGHGSATIVGQSLGGGIALQFAYQYPERCERLVLVAAGGLGKDVVPLLRGLAAPGVEYVLPIAFQPVFRDAINSVARQLRRVGITAGPETLEIWRSYSSLIDPATRTAFLRTLRTVVDVRGQLVSAHDRLYLAEAMPTLIVWGDHDPIIPVSHAYEAHEAIPGSRLEVFEGSGHFPHCHDPERFVEVLLDFVATTEPADFSHAEWAERLGAVSA